MPKYSVIDKSSLTAIPEVPFTDTWAPIHHTVVVDKLDRQLATAGVEVHSARLEVSGDGANLFGTYALAPIGIGGTENVALPQIGFRNSMNKAFALGLVAGMQIMVCSNMSFSGEFISMRKHTSGIVNELPSFMEGAIDMVRDATGKYVSQFEAWGQHLITRDQFQLHAYELMARGILPGSNFGAFHAAWQAEAVDNPTAPTSLQTLYGSVTRAIRGKSVAQVQSRTRDLSAYVDHISVNSF